MFTKISAKTSNEKEEIQYQKLSLEVLLHCFLLNYTSDMAEGGSFNEKYILLLTFFLISLPMAFAANIVMSVDQSTYYFKTGENAIIPMKLDNN